MGRIKSVRIIDAKRLHSKIQTKTTSTLPTIGTVNPATGNFRYRPTEYNWKSIRKCDYVQGTTLNRIIILDEIKKDRQYSVLIKTASEHMKEIGCDNCAGPHAKTNKRCSVNIGLKETKLKTKYDITKFQDVRTMEFLPGKWRLDLPPNASRDRNQVHRGMLTRIS